MAGAPDCLILTPAGVGGVAVLALCGGRRWEQGLQLLRPASGAKLSKAVGPQRAELWLAGERLDDVLVVDRPELDQLEIHTHGAPAVLAAIQDEMPGCRREQPSAAQALLWNAMGRRQLALALEQLQSPLEPLLAAADPEPLRAALDRSPAALAQVQPARLVICGAQNAGKSTLMNRLLHQERVLTGATPGLTRDPVQEVTLLDGYPYLLVDTAGDGPVQGAVDRQAQHRARGARRTGWRLLVVDASVGPGELEQRLMQPATLVIENKIDLLSAATGAGPTGADWPPALSPRVSLSCLDPAAAADIRRQVGSALRRLRGLGAAGPVGGPAALDADQLAELRARLGTRPCDDS